MDQFPDSTRDVLLRLMTRVSGLAANLTESLVARDMVTLEIDWPRLQTIMVALDKHLDDSIQQAKARSRIKTCFDAADDA